MTSAGARIEEGYPVVVHAEADPLPVWYEAHRDWIDAHVLSRGAVLFRGFGVNDRDAFSEFTRIMSTHLLDYVGGNTPRTSLGGGVYTSTEYPAKYPISLHNELSYEAHWPQRIAFCCTLPSETGGETPIADSRSILRALSPPVVEAFRTRGVRYVRMLHGGRGAGPSWQDTFKSTDKAAVEAARRDAYSTFTWTSDGGLRIATVRPAIATHPVTGEALWFNQAEQFHPSCMGPELRAAMMVVCGGDEDRLPQNATFGDGSPIEDGMLDEIRRVIREQAVMFPWQRGDVLLLDNMLACHGRMPYTGKREVLVAMAAG